MSSASRWTAKIPSRTRRIRPKKTLPATNADTFESDSWPHLPVQLDVILIRLRSPADAQDIHQLDLRRRSTAVRNLALEPCLVLEKMNALGLPQSLQVSEQAKAPAAQMTTRSLGMDLQVLAQAFEECAKSNSVRRKSTIKKWHFSRSQIHRELTFFLTTV